MKIVSSSLQLNSSHAQFQRGSLLHTSNSLDKSDAKSSDAPNISNLGRQLQNSNISDIKAGLDAAENDPTLNLIRAMIFMLTGKEVKVLNLSDLMGQTDDSKNLSTVPASATPSPSPSTSGFDSVNTETLQMSYSEAETTTFNAAGTIKTSDNKIINFNLSFSMSYSYNLELAANTTSNAPRKMEDPLVLNFAGTGASLSNQRFKFDLNSDGSAEEINLLSSGNGYLALDLNNDGKINNGSELFGSTSGNGFGELARLDSDSNGWIDENDVDYSKLLVWRKDSTGNDALSSLSKEGVGAISLSNINTPFSLKDTNNELLGQLKDSSLFITDTGGAGLIQQIDVTI